MNPLGGGPQLGGSAASTAQELELPLQSASLGWEADPSPSSLRLPSIPPPDVTQLARWPASNGTEASSGQSLLQGHPARQVQEGLTDQKSSLSASCNDIGDQSRLSQRSVDEQTDQHLQSPAIALGLHDSLPEKGLLRARSDSRQSYKDNERSVPGDSTPLLLRVPQASLTSLNVETQTSSNQMNPFRCPRSLGDASLPGSKEGNGEPGFLPSLLSLESYGLGLSHPTSSPALGALPRLSGSGLKQAQVPSPRVSKEGWADALGQGGLGLTADLSQRASCALSLPLLPASEMAASLALPSSPRHRLQLLGTGRIAASFAKALQPLKRDSGSPGKYSPAEEMRRDANDSRRGLRFGSGSLALLIAQGSKAQSIGKLSAVSARSSTGNGEAMHSLYASKKGHEDAPGKRRNRSSISPRLQDGPNNRSPDAVQNSEGSVSLSSMETQNRTSRCTSPISQASKSCCRQSLPNTTTGRTRSDHAATKSVAATGRHREHPCQDQALTSKPRARRKSAPGTGAYRTNFPEKLVVKQTDNCSPRTKSCGVTQTDLGKSTLLDAETEECMMIDRNAVRLDTQACLEDQKEKPSPQTGADESEPVSARRKSLDLNPAAQAGIQYSRQQSQTALTHQKSSGVGQTLPPIIQDETHLLEDVQPSGLVLTETIATFEARPDLHPFRSLPVFSSFADNDAPGWRPPSSPPRDQPLPPASSPTGTTIGLQPRPSLISKSSIQSLPSFRSWAGQGAKMTDARLQRSLNLRRWYTRAHSPSRASRLARANALRTVQSAYEKPTQYSPHHSQSSGDNSKDNKPASKRRALDPK